MNTLEQRQALLDRVQRFSAYVGRWPVRARSTATASRASLMARTVKARYAWAELRWPVLDLVFDLPHIADATASSIQHVTYAPHFLNPRVLLRLLVSQHPVSLDRKAEPPRKGTSPVDAIPLTLPSQGNQTTFHRYPVEIVERILRQGVRKEFDNPAMATAANRPGIPPQFAQPVVAMPRGVQLPPARVFRQPAVAPVEADAGTDDRRSVVHKSLSGIGNGANTPNSNMPTVDLGRLTDQVLQALDHRIIAQRERMGRI